MPGDMLGRGEAVRAAEALDMLQDIIVASPAVEKISINKAFGRVVSEDIISPENLPDFDRSTMDGYAVRAADTFGCSESTPAYLRLTGEVRMGEEPDIDVSEGLAVSIPTGGMLPAGADAVVMFERAQSGVKDTLEVLRPVAPGENVISAGEDIKAGDVVLRRGVILRPQDIAALAGLGITEVTVFGKPVVGIISTGDEIVPAENRTSYGQVRDMNSFNLSGLIMKSGAEPRVYGIFKDEYDVLNDVINTAVGECDMVLISGGSSVGTRDITAEIIESIEKGGVLFHGVAVKPGKPLIGAFVKGTPVFGLPGHPAAVTVSFINFVRPVLRKVAGISTEKGDYCAMVQAILLKNIASAAGREDYVRVALVNKDGILYAEPVLGKSGLINTLVRADGLIRVPEKAQGIREGEKVEVRLFE